MTNPEAGHGTLIAVQLTPGGAFTNIAELGQDIKWPALSRGEVETTSHQNRIDRWNLGVMRRGPLTFGVNYIFDNNTHGFSTGLYGMIEDNLLRGFRLRGPTGTTGVDEWIASGQVQNIEQTAPVREGVRSCDVTVRLSGPMIIDGVEFGADV